MLSIIVAVAKNNVIGKDNKLLWNIKNDLRRFRSMTENHVIIMGRKTFESLGGVLPNRKHIVLSKTITDASDYYGKDVVFVDDLNKLKEYINSDEECFVIGGGMIYRLLMPFVTKMYITKIDEEFEGDTYFAEFNEDEWEISSEERVQDSDVDFEYRYVTYERVKPHFKNL